LDRKRRLKRTEEGENLLQGQRKKEKREGKIVKYVVT
jgi:hypothetical protein